MNLYSKYSDINTINNSADLQQKNDGKIITQYSTPEEISEIISEKLKVLIEQQIKDKSDVSTEKNNR